MPSAARTFPSITTLNFIKTSGCYGWRAAGGDTDPLALHFLYPCDGNMQKIKEKIPKEKHSCVHPLYALANPIRFSNSAIILPFT